MSIETVISFDYGYQEAVSKKGKVPGFVIGSARFRKISAAEGIRYSSKMKGGAALSKSTDLTPEERRKTIVKAYRKA
jgi:hypothetical protein